MPQSPMIKQSIGLAHRTPPPPTFSVEETKGYSASVATAPLLLVLFIFSVVPPVYFNLGETRLSITRVVLAILFIPLLFRLIKGAAGRLMAIDVLMFLFAAWIFITILYNNGTARFPLAVATILEMLGGYLVGRTLIRNANDYQILIRNLVIILLILFPFSLLEYFTNRNLLKDAFGVIFNTFDKPLSQTWRNGFSRVSSGFEHPILYGLFCAMTLAPLYYFYRANAIKAICVAALALVMTYMSLSSAPIIAAGICIMLILWDHATGARWRMLFWIAVALYIFLTIASNRGPLVILIDYLTFNPHTAWTRIWTFRYGSIEVMRHPILGMGIFSDWDRPPGLTPSVDNFWLVIAMRHGLVGLAILVLALGFGIRSVVRANLVDSAMRRWRTGHVVALVGLFFSLATVHMWGDTSAFIMFFIGAGMWFATTVSVPVNPSSLQSTDIDVHHLGAPLPPIGRKDLPTSRFSYNHKRRTP